MPAFITEWQFYSEWIAVISFLVGSFSVLKQRKLKTLLAYSSINHMGYALLAFRYEIFF
jgi:NADH:ubiquinone oxidoreductase subunit 2 (subunit N)